MGKEQLVTIHEKIKTTKVCSREPLTKNTTYQVTMERYKQMLKEANEKDSK